MKKVTTIAIAAVAMGFTALAFNPAQAYKSKAPDGATATILSPADGSTVENPVTIQFGLAGMGIAPAGVEKENTGHHHLLINVDPASVDMDNALPATDQVVHFGGGQTQVTKELPAGTHTLRILLGDHNHIPHEPPVMSDPITITVK